MQELPRGRQDNNKDDITAADREAAHEGDSALYVQLAMMCMGVRNHTEMVLMSEKINLAYTRYAITMQEWERLYNIMNGRNPEDIVIGHVPARVDNDEPVYPIKHVGWRE